MKRFHVHLHVDDLVTSVASDRCLFAAEPCRLEAAYAKWMLEGPRINFAISARGALHRVAALPHPGRHPCVPRSRKPSRQSLLRSDIAYRSCG